MARGTPHLMEDYSATGDVFTRMIPVLTGLAVLEALGALDADFSWWQNVLAGVGGLALLIGLWAGINALRGRPPSPGRLGGSGRDHHLRRRPGPHHLPHQPGARSGHHAGGGQHRAARGHLRGHQLRTRPAHPLGAGQDHAELGAVAGLLGRALPLLLLIQIALFINTEMWQVADGFDGRFLAAVVVLFVLIGITFLLTRLPRARPPRHLRHAGRSQGSRSPAPRPRAWSPLTQASACQSRPRPDNAAT